MSKLLNEIKRLQHLAGINEINVRKPETEDSFINRIQDETGLHYLHFYDTPKEAEIQRDEDLQGYNSKIIKFQNKYYLFFG
jgi:hypothetical protein